MTTTAELLADGFERVRTVVAAALDGVDEAALTWRADESANTIAWLVWHLARVQDDHIAGAFGTDEVWPEWAERFDFDGGRVGYGDSSADVAAVRAPASLLLGYLDAVHARTLSLVATVDDAALDEVVDEHWDPPVTRSVRLVSVLSDDLQHAGQAAFVRGLYDRRHS